MKITYCIVILLFLMAHEVFCQSYTDDDEVIEKVVPILSASERASFYEYMSCQHADMDLGKGYAPSCLVPEDRCMRKVVDDLFGYEDIERLKAIALKGMSSRNRLGGPTILDISTGYIRDTDGLENLFAKPNDIFTTEDFEHYGSIIKRLKNGEIGWKPRGIHDEYWHPHADMSNTGHYHYSGLLYLSTYNEDFSGGRFIFTANSTDKRDHQQIVEPYAGRAVFFTSGPENKHYVERVTSGQRLVLAFWFTCNPQRQFEMFLDGKQHLTFSHRVRTMEENKRKKAEEDSSGNPNKRGSRRGRRNTFTPPDLPKVQTGRRGAANEL